MSSKKPIIIESDRIYNKAKKIIPCQTQTLSKAPFNYVDGVSPKYLLKGKGCHVWDVDGNEYIDYGMALGPISLGYCYDEVDNVIKEQLKDAINLTLMHPLEVEVAELLIDVIPCAQMVRFGKNGSDATAAAIRLARAYTGRDLVVCCGYHGWQDWYAATLPINDGIPEAIKKLTIKFDYNDIDSLKRIVDENKNEVACIIIEPSVATLPENDFLNKAKELCHKNDAVFIFDEIKTGFRIAIGGAQEYFGVIPDIATFGKAMGNGMPISAIVGNKEIMSCMENIFFSFTSGGELLSLAATKATIKEMISKNAIDKMDKIGSRLKVEYNRILKDTDLETFMRFEGMNTYNVLSFLDLEKAEIYKSLLMQEMVKRGILFGGYNIICFSHEEEDIDKSISSFSESAEMLSTWIKDGNEEEKLEGKVTRPVFKRY